MLPVQSPPEPLANGTYTGSKCCRFSARFMIGIWIWVLGRGKPAGTAGIIQPACQEWPVRQARLARPTQPVEQVSPGLVRGAAHGIRGYSTIYFRSLRYQRKPWAGPSASTAIRRRATGHSTLSLRIVQSLRSLPSASAKVSQGEAPQATVLQAGTLQGMVPMGKILRAEVPGAMGQQRTAAARLTFPWPC